MKKHSRKQVVFRWLWIFVAVVGGFLILTGERVDLSCRWTKSYENVVCSLSSERLLKTDNTEFVLLGAKTQKQYYSTGGRHGNVLLRYYLITVLSTENGEIQLPSETIEPEELVKKLNTLLESPSIDEMKVEIKDTLYVSYGFGMIFIVGSLSLLFRDEVKNRIKSQH